MWSYFILYVTLTKMKNCMIKGSSIELATL